MDFVMRFSVLRNACFQFLCIVPVVGCQRSISVDELAFTSVRDESARTTASWLQNAAPEEDLSGIEGRFIDRRGERVDGRQMSSWIEIRNLSTSEITRAKVDELGNFRVKGLSAGNYRIWVRRKSRDTCGVRRKSWKLELRPYAVSKFVGVIEWMDSPCVLE